MAPGTLQRLWRGIERGLDNLADIEDVVTGTAQRLYETTVDAIPRRASPEDVAFTDPTVKLALKGRKIRPADRATEDEGPALPFQKMARYEAALSKRETDANSPVAHEAAVRKTLPWNDVASSSNGIRTNGGASTDRQPWSASPRTTGHPVSKQSEPRPIERFPVLDRPHGDEPSVESRPPSKLSHSIVDDAYTDYADDDSENLLQRAMSILPRISLSNPFRSDSVPDMSSSLWDAEDDEDASETGFFSIFRRSGKGRGQASFRSMRASHHTDVDDEFLNQPLQKRIRDGSPSLLTSDEERMCRRIGSRRAFFDLMFVGFLASSFHELPPMQPEMFHGSLATVLSAVAEWIPMLADSWSPILFAAALLAASTSHLVTDQQFRTFTAKLQGVVELEATRGDLVASFLALTAGSSLPHRTGELAWEQAVAAAHVSRVHSFTSMAILALIVFSVSGPGSHVFQLFTLLWTSATQFDASEMKLSFNGLASSIGVVLPQIKSTISASASTALHRLTDSPLKLAFEGSALLSLLAFHFVATAVARIPSKKQSTDDAEEAELELEAHREATGRLSALSSSSATRLFMLGQPQALSEMVQRWSATVPGDTRRHGLVRAENLFVLGVFGFAIAALAVLPFLIHRFVDNISSSAARLFLQVDSQLDVLLLLVMCCVSSWKSIWSTLKVKDIEKPVSPFLKALDDSTLHRKVTIDSRSDLALQAAISPTSGLLVRDLWAAHSLRRAWAVRGANLSCRNGEVVVILGDDGAGKTRMLTSISEAIFDSPKDRRSTTIVRGAIQFGSVNVDKWDRSQLIDRTGILLNDARSISDLSNAFSGLTVEEILLDDTADAPTGLREAASVAMKISGLYESLVHTLPLKLKTVVTASEDDLRPSALRPTSHILSQAEWYRLLLTKVLCRAIYENENSAGSNREVKNSLVGSMLLLDDGTGYMSELEEGKFFEDLRATGACSILTSSRWATGRFADRVVIMKNGAVVESGSHDELLSRGPQQSVYAARWNAMTQQ